MLEEINLYLILIDRVMRNIHILKFPSLCLDSFNAIFFVFFSASGSGKQNRTDIDGDQNRQKDSYLFQAATNKIDKMSLKCDGK